MTKTTTKNPTSREVAKCKKVLREADSDDLSYIQHIPISAGFDWEKNPARFKKSKGHLGVNAGNEYFVREGDIIEASIDAPVMPDGYRAGRFWATETDFHKQYALNKVRTGARQNPASNTKYNRVKRLVREAKEAQHGLILDQLSEADLRTVYEVAPSDGSGVFDIERGYAKLTPYGKRLHTSMSKNGRQTNIDRARADRNFEDRWKYGYDEPQTEAQRKAGNERRLKEMRERNKNKNGATIQNSHRSGTRHIMAGEISVSARVRNFLRAGKADTALSYIRKLESDRKISHEDYYKLLDVIEDYTSLGIIENGAAVANPNVTKTQIKEFFTYLDKNGERKLVAKYSGKYSANLLDSIISTWAVSNEPLNKIIDRWLSYRQNKDIVKNESAAVANPNAGTWETISGYGLKFYKYISHGGRLLAVIEPISGKRFQVVESDLPFATFNTLAAAKKFVETSFKKNGLKNTAAVANPPSLAMVSGGDGYVYTISADTNDTAKTILERAERFYGKPMSHVMRNRPIGQKLFGKKKNETASDFKRFTKDRLIELSKMFQGEASGARNRALSPDMLPQETWRLGYLVQMKIRHNGKVNTINFDGESYLAGDLRCNLWAVGKDARIEGIRKPSEGQLKKLGKLIQVDYVTAKKHIEGGKVVRFWHPLGEVNKDYPTLYIDHDGFPIILGGGYDIWNVGIVN
jgi:hypothetical protein